MKALTVRQPFASLIVHGAKKLETRNWTTDYRGPLLIHSARAEPMSWDIQCGASALISANLPPTKLLPRGAIIGAVELVAVHTITKEFTEQQTRDERLLGNYVSGWFAWELAYPVYYPTPIQCFGNIRLWTPSERVLADVSRAFLSSDCAR